MIRIGCRLQFFIHGEFHRIQLKIKNNNEMKTIIATFLITLFTCALGYAQTENNTDEVQTIFSSGAKVTGWFIDFNNTFSQLNGQNGYMPGFAGGVIMNHNFKIGFIGKSLTCHETYLKYDNIFDEPVYLVGGHGALYFEASPIDNKAIHISFPFIIGGGGAEYISQNLYPEIEDEGEIDYERKHMSSSPYWIAEPGANIEINVTGFMRLYAGYSYRWLMGLNLENTSAKALNGSNFNFGVRFGKL